MKLRTISLFVGCAMLAVTASAQSLKAAANRMNHKVDASFMKNDGLKTFEELTRNAVTSDFKHTEGGNSMDYDQMLGMMKQSMGMLHVTYAHTSASHVKQHGKMGSAMCSHSMRGTMMEGSKKHRFAMTGRTKESFRKEDGKWKMSEMRWTTSKMTMDGKPFDPSKMMGGGGEGH